MNQPDETVVVTTSPMPNANPSPTPNQGNESPSTGISAPTQVPTAPMTFATNLPDMQASTSSDIPVVATQPIIDSQLPGKPDISPTSIAPTPVTVDVPSVEATPEPIKTIPLSAQENSDGLPMIEAKPVEMPQASVLPPLPPISAPISQAMPDDPKVSAPSMPVASDAEVTPASEIPSIEPQLGSATSPNLPIEPVTPVGMPNPSLPPLGEKPSLQPPVHEPMDPIVIEAKPPVNPEPLPAPLTPPTIKTTPSPVLSNPSSSQVTAPINVAMSSPQVEPLNKPAGIASPVLVKGAGKYQIRVINEKCIGAASCVAVAPKAFKLNEQQIAEVLASASEESDENLLLSAQSCPTMAIEIIDSETGKKVWPR